jgi:hypothetical protein
MQAIKVGKFLLAVEKSSRSRGLKFGGVLSMVVLTNRCTGGQIGDHPFQFLLKQTVCDMRVGNHQEITRNGENNHILLNY